MWEWKVETIQAAKTENECRTTFLARIRKGKQQANELHPTLQAFFKQETRNVVVMICAFKDAPHLLLHMVTTALDIKWVSIMEKVQHDDAKAARGSQLQAWREGRFCYA